MALFVIAKLDLCLAPIIMSNIDNTLFYGYRIVIAVFNSYFIDIA